MLLFERVPSSGSLCSQLCNLSTGGLQRYMCLSMSWMTSWIRLYTLAYYQSLPLSVDQSCSHIVGNVRNQI